MAKLYAPKLERILPAQSGDDLKIPFDYGNAVSTSDIEAIGRIIVRNLASNEQVMEQDVTIDNNIAICELISNQLQIGMFYKLQMCFKNRKGEYGYYSEASVFKYVSNNIELSITTNGVQYIGSVNLQTSSEEKVYSYKFDLYNDADELIETSGIQYRQQNASEDIWEFNSPVFNGYKIKYSIITINNYQNSTEMTVSLTNTNLEINASVYTTSNDMIAITGTINNDNFISIEFYRSIADMNDWQKIYTFYGNQGDIYYIDPSIEQGVQYDYAYRGWASGTTCTKIKCLTTNKKAQVNFEDILLFDGERQLTIRFNPKISSFKSTILEQKIDTLGGQFPVFFRNGNVNYKEFQISGLISMLMDEHDFFIINLEEAKRENTPSKSVSISTSKNTNLTSENYYNERQFKLEVLKWLNNGKPKLFRSAAEGNYIIRLMNVSLTPNDTLGRMLHTFSATAYEVAECNCINLKKYGIMKAQKVEDGEINA